MNLINNNHNILTAPPAKDEDANIGSFAAELLSFGCEYKEFQKIYDRFDLINELLQNIGSQLLCFERIQDWFNCLKNKVDIVKKIDPRIEILFNSIIKNSNPKICEGSYLASIKHQVSDIISAENISDAGAFAKHGIVCVKDEYIVSYNRPINMVNQKQLSEMIELRKILFDPDQNVIQIQEYESLYPEYSQTDFVKKIHYDFEKILTFEVGRALVRKLIKHKKGLKIENSTEAGFDPKKNRILLSLENNCVIGLSKEGFDTTTAIPTWITLAHELTHALHSYEGGMHVDVLTKDPRWSNVEEYITIGDPTKNLYEISENHFIKFTHHLLRNYHIEGSYDELTYEALNGLDGDLIFRLKSNGSDLNESDIKTIIESCSIKISLSFLDVLLQNPIAKKIIEENLFAFFITAKGKNNQAVLNKLYQEFGEEKFQLFKDHENINLFLSLKNIYLKLSLENCLDINYNLKENSAQIITENLLENFSAKMVNQLLNDAVGKKIIEENLFMIFLKAKQKNKNTLLENLTKKFGKEKIQSFEDKENLHSLIDFLNMNIDLYDLIAASFLTKELNFSESVFENLNTTTDFSTFDLRYLKILFNSSQLREVLKENYFFFINAKANNYTDILATFKSSFPDNFEKFSKSPNTQPILDLLKQGCSFEEILASLE